MSLAAASCPSPSPHPVNVVTDLSRHSRCCSEVVTSSTLNSTRRMLLHRRRSLSSPPPSIFVFSTAVFVSLLHRRFRPRSFKQKEAEYEEDIEDESEEEAEEESEDESDVKKKGHEALIEVDNPNRAKPKTLKAKDLDATKTTELSRREREELEKQRAHERYMRLQEQGRTEQARKDLGKQG